MWRSHTRLVQHGVNKPTIINLPKAYAVFVLTFDFHPAVLAHFYMMLLPTLFFQNYIYQAFYFDVKFLV